MTMAMPVYIDIVNANDVPRRRFVDVVVVVVVDCPLSQLAMPYYSITLRETLIE